MLKYTKKVFSNKKYITFFIFMLISTMYFNTSNLNAAEYDIIVANDGSGDYSTVQSAINAIPDNQSSWYTVYIKNGTYTEIVNIPSNKTYLHLIGESKDGVQITYNNSSSSAGGTSKSATVTNSAENFIAQNISFINSFDYDNSTVANKQGVSVLSQADRQIYDNCNFIGHQDTLYVKNGRQYFNNCYIEGVVDFIFGNGTSVFNNCTINCHYRSGGTGSITASSTLSNSEFGLVFIGCKITADSSVKDGGFSLGRPWHPSSSSESLSSSTVYLNCELPSAAGIWTDMGEVSWENERFYEYNSTGGGADTSRPQLSDSQAADYTVSNILKGSDDWSVETETSSTKPPASDPVILSGQAGDGEVSLSWSELPEINGLSVYVDTDSDPSGRVLLDKLSSDITSYTAVDLINGTAYWFWIKYRTSADDVWHNSEAFNATPEGVSDSGNILVNSISINASDITDGSEQQLSLSIRPSDASIKTVDWSVDDTSIASISSTGLLTPKDDGRVTVTATATDGSDVDDSVVIDISGIDSSPVAGTVVETEEEILSAIESASAGSVIYIRGGTYSFDSTIKITQNGTSSNKIKLANYPSDPTRPVFDFSDMSEDSSNRGFELSGDYWEVYGIDVKNAGDNGMFISGSDNIIEFSTFSENSDTGLQLGKGASNNLIKNVDSFYNADSSLENADGFAAKLDVGSGNKFYGCRSYNNLDDGFDGYLRGADNVTTTYENTWAFSNGYLKDGSLGAGDGNGFKTGGSDDKDLEHNAVYINTIAAGNAVDGYDHNSNRGTITIYNAIAHDNGKNINFSSTNSARELIIKNTVSLDSGSGDSLKADSTDIENNSWQDVSTSGGDFVSVDIADLMAPRKSDGSLPDIEYFHLESNSDLIDAGVDVGLDYNGSAPDIGAFEYE